MPRDTPGTVAVMPLQRRTPLPRGGPLRPRSPKRVTLYRQERIPLVRALLTEHPTCQRCQAAPSTDVHEILSRARGGSITDPDNLACLCRPCHDWITTHHAEAQAQGWLRASWDHQ